ncbi:aldose epimerase family protein [Flagellimonas algicola]|uniref:Aldose 1-epimerase n=1 Tax=Flagellimonas algicola TaxID=2583815 RepID=A0ABY2WJE9_9FLAO|nr:aldose epimerase family protein [Allomuricauda algicola]TMU54636.1 galactose mutarotase [Allomuricauda algicola]
MTIEESTFGHTKENKEVSLFKLSNGFEMKVEILNYGGIIKNIFVPDRYGKVEDVVLGHDDILGYEEKSDYFGCIAGRFANRINQGRFYINGTQFQLPQNSNGNSLHGGVKGFDKQVWEAQVFNRGKEVGVSLFYLSKDGEEDYPGNMKCWVTYTLDNSNQLRIEYRAETDKTTIVNLTNHTYFNLKDGGETNILDHNLRIYASHYTPVDSNLIPFGTLDSVEDTPFDFREFAPIGDKIDQEHTQLVNGGGYDHNFVLDKNNGECNLIASVYEPISGRMLEVLTTEPGIQFYSGNFLKGDIVGKNNVPYEYRSGLCLETQHFPDSPNHKQFPSTILNPGEQFESTTIYKFGVEP